ncbi:MAG: T9SS type A sorting domain-containing protein [Flavobacteriaceae bacterium]|nr:T9SS type A sorting domain-containing protein [Flavobacteriaceae bacterium]
MEKKHIFFTVIVLLSISINFGQTSHVPKTFNKPVLMHYMPWFETPEFNGNWGWHWTMNNQNPNIIVDSATGKRQIASHFYPLIGPYSSIDADVIEYHLLLMKYAGVDCVSIDWYGVKGSNGDINSLLANSNAIIDKTQEMGLDFALILEDRFSRSLSDIQDNLDYANNNYFGRSNYFRYGLQNKPFVGIFGPITYQNESDWDLIMPFAGEDLTFLTLWNESSEVGTHASGEYAWIYEVDANNDHLTYLNDFYTNRAPLFNTTMGVTYPGFKDFYNEGNAGAGFFTIEHSGINTLTETLQLVTQYNTDIDLLQLATWNDFGEGTMFEPTQEFGFSFLTTIQNYLGVSFGLEELQQIHRLYKLRKQFVFDTDVQQMLDQASTYFSELNPEQAILIMDNIEGGSLSINSFNKTDLKVFPNPFEDKIQIHFEINLNNPVSISVYSLNGQLILNESVFLKDNMITLNGLERLKAGIYIVQVRTDNVLQNIKIFKR